MPFEPGRARKLVEELAAQLAADPALGAVIHAILDRCDRDGSSPKQMLLGCGSEQEREAAVRLLSAAAVKPSADRGRAVMRLDLARAAQKLAAEGGPPLESILYAAAGRPPRNLRAEKEALANRAAAAALALAARQAGLAARFLQEAAPSLARAKGELFDLAASHGLDRLCEELRQTASCLHLAETNDRPVRLANFSLRATGSSKGLRPGDGRYERVADALLRYLAPLADWVNAESPPDPASRRRLALEGLQIFRNESAVDVLCYGHLVLEKRGRRLEQVAIHRELGEPARLLLLHLRDVRVAEIRASQVLSVENETTFNDYVDWMRRQGDDQVVLCSHGQANWALVRLLRLLADAAPRVPLVHWGDLDRFGVLILRSLRRRTGLPVDPLWMDPATFQRLSHAGLPLPPGEREEIDALLRQSPAAVGSDLLEAIRRAGVWVEQEAVAERVLTSG